MAIVSDKVIIEIGKIRDYVMLRFLGGKPVMKLATLINFFKGATFFYVAMLMLLFEDYSLRACLYLALHGSYGMCWLLKDRAFPDPGWEQKVTLGSLVVGSCLLIAYWMMPLAMFIHFSTLRQKQLFSKIEFATLSVQNNTNYEDISNARVLLALFLYILGVVIMIASDCQKYYQLKNMPPGKKLINDGMFKLTRNPNYLGEIMLYLSFAIVTEQLISYVICGTIWSTLFFVNIRCKEISLARKPGWEQYKKTSGMLLPKLW